MKLWMKLLLNGFIIIALVIVGMFGFTLYELRKVNTTKISKTNENLGIKSTGNLEKEDDRKVINIALFGVDRRVKSEPSRSDSIMILSIDIKNKEIKMSSIMRDTYVQIKDHGETKINHAYAFGGPQLAIRTLNENLNLDIKNYVTVDFFNLEKIIDAIGGVTVDVKQDEISSLNINMLEAANIEKKSITEIVKPGLQKLNGPQAVGYSRIRHDAEGDFRRTERQRIVLAAMITNIQSLGITEYPSVVSKLLPLTETSMSSLDIIKLGTRVFTANIKTLQQERFPVDGYWEGKIMDGVWYLVADMETTVDQLHKFIYEDIKPVGIAPKS
jgi:LCP family protein required for cell wall assembly